MLPDADRPVRRALHDTQATSGPPGLRMIRKGDTSVSKAPADGFYTITGENGRTHRFRVRKDAVLPPGAVFVKPGSEPSAPKPDPILARQARRGEEYAACLVAAGFSLFKEAELVEGQLMEVSEAESGEQLADLLRAAGYELKAAKKPKGDDKPAEEQPKPEENAQGSGPSETS